MDIRSGDIKLIKTEFGNMVGAAIIAVLKAARNYGVEQALEICSDMLGAHGVEVLSNEHVIDDWGLDTHIMFVNMGDSYVLTIAYDTQQQLFMCDDLEGLYDVVEKFNKKFKPE